MRSDKISTQVSFKQHFFMELEWFGAMDESDGQSSLLVVIIDTNPVWWGQRSLEADGVSLESYIIAQQRRFARVFILTSHSRPTHSVHLLHQIITNA